jgi:hypothetical protein
MNFTQRADARNDDETLLRDSYVDRLAWLPILRYERERRAAACLLGIRVSTLDALVELRRREIGRVQ